MKASGFRVRPGTALACAAWAALGVSEASAAVVATGNVDPLVTLWWQGMDAYVGRTAPGTLRVDAGSTLYAMNGYVGGNSGVVGAVTVEGARSRWDVGFPGGFSNGHLLVGDSGDGTLNVTNGAAVANTYTFIGNNGGATGAATVSGPSTWTGTGDMHVGHNGSGTLNITNGGVYSSPMSFASIATGAGSTGVLNVSGAGSKFETGYRLHVGNRGHGTLNISGGGTVLHLGEARVGDQAGSTGVVTVDGPGSTWTNGAVTIGNLGNGTVKILNGATASGPGTIGMGTRSVGSLTVDGAGSRWTNGPTRIGFNGNGTLTISNGGVVTGTSRVDVGRSARGVVTVGGAGSRWESGGLTLGSGGTATLNIDGGAAVLAGFSVETGPRGAIHFGPSGGSLTTQTFYAPREKVTGTGTVNARGLGFDGDLVFDSSQGLVRSLAWNDAIRDVTVNLDLSGAAGPTGSLAVGIGGTGALTIRDGVTVSTLDGAVGYGIGSSGVATVDGAGSTWSNRGSLRVGYTGNGSLNIVNGGSVLSKDTSIIGGDGTAVGAVTVDGSGSTWTNTGELNVGQNSVLHITNGGTVNNMVSSIWGPVNVDGATSTWGMDKLSVRSKLAIMRGANVTVGGDTEIWPNGSIDFGAADGTLTTRTLYAGQDQAQGKGTIRTRGLIVDAELVFDGSQGQVREFRWQNPGQDVTVALDMSGSSGPAGVLGVGDRGTGSILIHEGATVTSESGYVGFRAGGTGRATVTGAGSTWKVGTGLSVGKDGSRGSLDVVRGGSISARSIGISPASTMSVDGNDTVVTGGGLSVSGRMTVSNGADVSVEHGSVSGNGALLRVAGAGTTIRSSGTVSVGSFPGSALRIEEGARVASASGLIGSQDFGNGVVMVDGQGSTWDSTGTIRVGGFGRGTLNVRNGGIVNGLIEVGSNSLLTFDTTVARANIGVNRGAVRMLADASAEAGIYPALRSNDGTFQVVGGVLDGIEARTVFVTPPQRGAAGEPIPLDLTETQRAMVGEGEGSLGASFLGSWSPKTLTFTATAAESNSLAALDALLDPQRDVLAAWDFDVAGYGVADPVYLSMWAGEGRSVDQLSVWSFDGSSWTEFAADDLSYDGTYSNFTVTGAAGTYALAAVVPEPAAAGLLAICGAGILARRRRRA